ncbi:Zinc finger CCCH domain-containing protein 6 [Sesamum angolense]|uniref:Zinc finger CCCH domain-containing protein 6 n=1 Tax=Sesamum angolense TaxID=2727404 RepID=A0AAE1W649_9LAMI|nr:Zinc finger CCCH domain-containing protein 6 [Sesamum angolense]
MGGSQKSKTVTWASDLNLCQVKLFLLEESPSQVGMATQDHLQAKPLWSLQSDIGLDDSLPPGFEEIQPANLWRLKLSQIPLMKWRCPPRFEVNSEWRVVAGEESKEMQAQNQREMRVLEAIYPRPSAIPPKCDMHLPFIFLLFSSSPSPSASVDVQDSIANDLNTPLIPVTPIEDEDAATDTSLGSLTTNTNPMISQPQHLLDGTTSSQCNGSTSPHTNRISATVMEPGILAAAQAALSSIISNSSNSERGSLIDSDLLIKILSDPETIGQFVSSNSASSSAQNGPPSSMQSMPYPSFQSIPTSGVQEVTQNMPSTSTQYMPNSRSLRQSSFDPVNVRRDPLSAHSLANGPSYPPQTRTGSIPDLRPSIPEVISAPAPSPSPRAIPVTKDINYYKSLVQQHGAERRDVLPQFAHQSNQSMGRSRDPSNFIKPRESKPRITKPCLFFNSSRGCRNGVNCAYQHDTSSQQRVNGIPEVHGAKRVKLDRGITGT